jgi:hypothetical protein
VIISLGNSTITTALDVLPDNKRRTATTSTTMLMASVNESQSVWLIWQFGCVRILDDPNLGNLGGVLLVRTTLTSRAIDLLCARFEDSV